MDDEEINRDCLGLPPILLSNVGTIKVEHMTDFGPILVEVDKAGDRISHHYTDHPAPVRNLGPASIQFGKDEALSFDVKDVSISYEEMPEGLENDNLSHLCDMIASRLKDKHMRKEEEDFVKGHNHVKKTIHIEPLSVEDDM